MKLCTSTIAPAKTTAGRNRIMDSGQEAPSSACAPSTKRRPAGAGDRAPTTHCSINPLAGLGPCQCRVIVARITDLVSTSVTSPAATAARIGLADVSAWPFTVFAKGSVPRPWITVNVGTQAPLTMPVSLHTAK